VRQYALFLSIILLAASCFSGNAHCRDRALVVGVNSYPALLKDGRRGQWDLGGAVFDARTFVDLLTDVFKFDPADIKQLTDHEATRAAILAGIEQWLIGGSAPGDRVVFYFAGHGATAYVDEGNGRRRLTSTLVPVDAAGDTDGGDNIRNLIDGPTIGSYLQRLKDRRVMVVADSCYSGSVTRDLDHRANGSGPRSRTITPRMPVGLDEATYTSALRSEVKAVTRLIDTVPAATPQGDLAVWSATTLGQVTYDLPDRPGGIFTQSFAEGLRSPNGAGSAALTAGALHNYVLQRAETFCRTNRPCGSLTPQLQAPAGYLTSPVAPERQAAPPPDSASQATADATSVLAHRNDFALDVEILPSAQQRRGDRVRFRIKSAEAGTLVVLDSGPDGKLRQIFPNEYSQKGGVRGAVRAAAALTIPDPSYGFVFEATDVGPGSLLVLVAEQALDLSHVVGAHLDMKPISKPRDLVVELADAVHAPHVTADLTVPNGPYRWAFKVVPYVVEP
jgi:hypothetical protein